MRTVLRAFTAALVALVCAPASSQVAPYPPKPVRIVIPVPPGGSQDTLARALANELARLWGQAVVIESRPGAGGVTAAAAVAQSAADGTTIFMADEVPLTITPFMHRNLPYDPVKDFAAVIALVQAAPTVIAPGSSAFRTIAQLVATAKAKPGAVNFGSWGLASQTHLVTEEFAALAGVHITHVPYKGGADVLRGLLSGEIQLAFTGLTPTLPHIRQGRLIAIAYAGASRSPLLPEVPTIAESGLPGFQASSWLGWSVPSATPRAIVNRIASDAGRVLSVQAFKDKYVTPVGFEVFNLPAEPFEQLISDRRRKNEALLKRLKLQGD